MLVIGYWSIRGLGAPLRMIAEYTQTPYKSVHYNVTQKDDGGWDVSESVCFNNWFWVWLFLCVASAF